MPNPIQDNDSGYGENAALAVEEAGESSNDWQNIIGKAGILAILGVICYLIYLVAGDFMALIHNYVADLDKRNTIVRIIISLCFITVSLKLFRTQRNSYEKMVWNIAAVASIFDLILLPVIARAAGQYGNHIDPMYLTILGLLSWLCSTSGLIALLVIEFSRKANKEANHLIAGDSKHRSAKNTTAAARMLQAANLEAETVLRVEAQKWADRENKKLAEAGVAHRWDPNIVYQRMVMASMKKKQVAGNAQPEPTFDRT